jgi:hypothetical protein
VRDRHFDVARSHGLLPWQIWPPLDRIASDGAAGDAGRAIISLAWRLQYAIGVGVAGVRKIING